MALKLRFARRALNDLQAIRDFLLDQNPNAADRVRIHLAATIERVVEFPLIGRATDQADVRVVQLSRYPYRIFYFADADAVTVLHIRHTAQKPVEPDDLA